MARQLLVGLWLTLVLGLVAAVPGMAAEGRWKVGDDGTCFFDPDDTGPDQCTRGRWKLGQDGDSTWCYFDGFDDGPDQCTLPTDPAAETASTRRR
jgi:hypothetical protein